MSTLDGHSKETSEDTAGGPIILFFILGLFASLIVGWIIFPKLLYSQKNQPIDFNHSFHGAEVGTVRRLS
jgi:hypothetical protein